MACQINGRKLRREVETFGAEKACSELLEAVGKKQLRPDECSLAALAEGIMGSEWLNSLNPKSGRYPSTAELQETAADAVASYQFSNITGQIFFTAVKESYELEELPFSKIVPTKPSKIKDMEKIAGISEVGDEFTVVGEGNTFPNFGVTEDWQEIAAKRKRGGIVPVTKEAVFFDLTGVLLDRCRGIGKWLAWNKEKRIIDAFVDEGAGAVSAALGGHRYHWKGVSLATHQSSSPWINIKTGNALVDYTDVENAWLIGAAMTDPYTGEPIVFRPKHLVVTMQNAMTAARLLRATNVQTHVGGYATSGNLVDMHSPSPLNEFTPGLSIVTSALLATRTATDTDWWLADVGRTVNYFENWGITPEEAPRDSQASFERDIVMQFKASEQGVASVVEPRATVESRA